MDCRIFTCICHIFACVCTLERALRAACVRACVCVCVCVCLFHWGPLIQRLLHKMLIPKRLEGAQGITHNGHPSIKRHIAHPRGFESERSCSAPPTPCNNTDSPCCQLVCYSSDGKRNSGSDFHCLSPDHYGLWMSRTVHLSSWSALQYVCCSNSF